MVLEDIKKIQNAQLSIMDDIHRVCVKNHLRYYLIGGSALGAVRHNGIIPWDVDIDIAMPRKDYELFLTKGRLDLSNRFELHYHETDRNFETVHALVVLKDSEMKFTYELNSNINSRFGVFVDILPLDQWPEDKALKVKQMKTIKNILFITNLHAGALLRTNDNPIKRFVKNLIRYCLKACISRYRLNTKLQNVLQLYDTEEEGNNWCSMTSHYSYEKLTMPKSVFGVPTLHEFSGRQYYVPENVRYYLKQLFGDYMKEPSEHQKLEQMNGVYSARWIDEDGKMIIVPSHSEN